MLEKVVVLATTADIPNDSVSFVSDFPAELRQQLHCGNESQQASVFHIDSNGDWRPATLDEVKKYDVEEYAKSCKDAG